MISNPSAALSRIGVVEAPSRFEIDDELWTKIEPLVSVRQRRYRYQGRKAIPDRLVLNGTLLWQHAIKPLIARRGTEHGSGPVATAGSSSAARAPA